MTAANAAIVGISGPALQPDEIALFRAHPPAGVILFGRNVVDRPQLASLMDSLRQVLPADAAVMVDQEGGRVARLHPPHWLGHPAAAIIGALFETDAGAALRAAWLTGALIGLDCREAGFSLVAAPVLDLSIPGTHDVIGDRAFGGNAVAVARLGRAMANGLLAAGIVPVGKHAPGHGRVLVDSHFALPVVPGADIRPFALNRDLPWLMTAHIVYQDIDPDAPGTLSAKVIGDVIRNDIGFKGVVVTDDLAMKALSGSPADLARHALSAGCDVALYCRGDFEATRILLETCPALTPRAVQGIAAGRALAETCRMTLDPSALANERARLLG